MFFPWIITLIILESTSIRLEDRHLVNQLEYSLKRLCPGVDICTADSVPSKNTVFANKYMSCCKACSCAKNCKIGTCCFNDTNDPQKRDSNVTCEYPLAYDSDFLRETQKYYMVMAPPETGCVGEYQSCDVTTIYPWGEVLPVSSKATNRIYRNPDCAKCHGLTENDYEKWNGILICSEYPFPINLHQLVESLIIEHELQSFCDVLFTYLGKNAYAGNEKCYTNRNLRGYSGCIKDFNIPPEINMTRDEILNACKYGPSSPIEIGAKSRVVFTNVFCYMCSSKKSLELYCTDEKGDNRGTGYRVFTAMITEDALDIVTRSIYESDTDNTNPVIPLACINTEHRPSQNWNVTDCRTVDCPVGKMRDKGGNCIYISERWTGVVYTLMLNINIDNRRIMSSVKIDDLVQSVKAMLNPPVFWRYKAVLQRYVCDDDPTSTLGLVVGFGIANTVQYDLVMANVSKILKGPWKLELPSTDVNVSITVDKYTRYDRSSFGNNILVPVIPMVDTLNTTTICNRVLEDDLKHQHGGQMLITKMYLCEQIQLLPGEYKLLRENIKAMDYAVLLYNARIYFPAEFRLEQSVEGDDIVKICLEESPFRNVFRATASSVWIRSGLVALVSLSIGTSSLCNCKMLH